MIYILEILFIIYLITLGTNYVILKEPFVINLNEAITYVFFIFLSIKIKLNIIKNIFKNFYLIKIFYIYIFIVSILSLFNIINNPLSCLSFIKMQLYPLLSIYIIYYLLKYLKINNILKIFKLSLLFFSIIGILQYHYGMFTIPLNTYNRNLIELIEMGKSKSSYVATGLFDHWNAYSIYMNFLIIPIIIKIIIEKKYSNIIIFFLGIYAIFISFSRSGIFISFLSVFFSLLFYSRKKIIRIFLLSIIIFSIYYTIKLLSNFKIEEIVFSTLKFRNKLWLYGFSIIKSNINILLTGYGPKTFINVVGLGYNALNLYLLTLFEFGIPGLIILLLLILNYYIIFFKEKSSIGKIFLLPILLFFLREFIENAFYSPIFKIMIILYTLLYYRFKNIILTQITQ